ncbi:MAG: copper amine oxidase N-terminal domain-containing protein [Firmicutes bacterium]|nr:copper amine oxidase N-terminal domain-containing protein [Bacillota bacterium]
MKKTVIALFLAAAVAAPAAGGARAAALIAPPANQPALPARIDGVITSVTDGGIEVKDSNTGASVVLSVSRDTFILDAGTGAATAVKDRENDSVIAYYGPVATASEPPQSNCLALFLNSTEELDTPHYAVAEAVEQKDGQTSVLIYNGSQYVTLTDSTPIFPYLTRNIVTKDMIRTGTKLALWYGITTLSYPGLAQASKAVILRQPALTADGGGAEAAPDGSAGGSASADDKRAALSAEFGGAEYDKNGVTMIPLRQAAEARGYAVGWDGGARAVSLEKDGGTILLYIGKNDYSGTELEYPPEITGGRTFVPASFLEHL